jgi:hypothetical protein
VISSALMRLVQATILSWSLALAPAAFAGDAEDPPPHHHPSGWYGGWTLVVAGGASTLVGVALTTRSDQPSTPAVGWSLAGMGTVSWVAGALILKLTERRELQKKAGR